MNAKNSSLKVNTGEFILKMLTIATYCYYCTCILLHCFNQMFKKMKIPQIRDPNLPRLEDLPESYKTKVAFLGCGPASISCATFLARFGYTNLTVFEKYDYIGGLR